MAWLLTSPCIASKLVILWGNKNIYEWDGKRERLNSGVVSPSAESVWTECLIVGLSTDKGTGLLVAEGDGKGSLKVWEERRTSSRRLGRPTWNALQFWQQSWQSHADSLMSWPICSDWEWLYYLHWWSPFWNSWEILLSNALLHCPHKYTHTCQTKFGNLGLASMRQFPEPLSSSSLAPAGNNSACQKTRTSQWQLWQSPILLYGEGVLFRTLYCGDFICSATILHPCCSMK